MRQLGPYRLHEPLGQGGAAVVFRGTGADGRDVAVKVLRDGASPAALERFAREARLLATGASGFVPLLDAGRAPEGAYLVMPLLRGGTLRDRLRHGPLPASDAVELVTTLARALGRAHRTGVVHRDVKPENVLFDAEGRPWIADLGVALHLGAPPSARLSRTGELRGTAGYMAPEQLADPRAVGPPVDVFALGAVLHEALAGRPAFEGASAVEVLARAAQGLREPLRGCPGWLAAAVDACLAPDPAARPADGEALARLLARGRAGAARRRPGRAAALAVGAVLALGAGAAVVAVRPATTDPAAAPSASSDPASTPSDAAPAVATPPPAPAPAGPPRLRLLARWGLDRARHPGARALAFVPARAAAPSLLATAGDGPVRLWRVDDGRAAGALEPPTAATFGSVAASPDGALVAAGAADGRVVVWERDGRVRTTLAGHEGEVTRLGFSGALARIVSVSLDGTLRLWDVDRGQLTAVTFSGPLRALGQGNEVLAAARLDGAPEVEIVDPARPTTPRVITPRPSPARDLAVRPDGLVVASLHDEGGLQLWDPRDGRPFGAARLPAEGSRVAWTAEGDRLVAALGDGTLAVFRVAPQVRLERRVRARRAVRALALSPDGKAAALLGEHGASEAEGRLSLWPLDDDGAERWPGAGHEGPVTVISAAGPGLVLTGGADGRRLLWATDAGVVRHDLERLRGPVRAAGGALSAADHVVFVPGLSGLPGVTPDAQLTVGRAPVHSIAVVASRWLLTADEDGVAAVWDLDRRVEEQGKWTAEHGLGAPTGFGRACATLLEVDDALLVVLGGADGRVLVTPPAEPAASFRLEAHAGPVIALAAAAGRVASAGEDGVVAVWDVARRAPLTRVTLGAPARGVAVDPLGVWLATVDREGRLGLWAVATGDLLGQVDEGVTCAAFDLTAPELFAGTRDGGVLRLACPR